jgi:hypothetical protein
MADADSIRQKIVDSVENAFGEISVANGYQTDAGANVFVWRDLNNDVPEETELPLINICDWKENTSPVDLGARHDRHELIFHIEGLCIKDSTHNASKMARKLLSDIIQVLFSANTGTGTFKWWPDVSTGAGLAFSTLPVDSNEGTNILDIEQKGRAVFSVKYQVRIEYRTLRGNPYAQ